MNDSSFLSGLGFELTLAMQISVLIIVIVLHVRIIYGDMIVTHMTTIPHKVTYIFLSLAIVECVVILFITEVTFDDYEDFEDFWIGKKWFNIAFFCFQNAKFL